MLSSRPAPVTRVKKGAACRDCWRRKRKCIHAQAVTGRTGVGNPVARSTILLHIPTCSETTLCLQFADVLRSLRLDHTWLQMMPCRLGNDKVVDTAITAVVKNADLALGTGQANVNASLSDYLKSVEVLRKAMESCDNSLSDQILMGVALLCVCESLMRSEMFACFAHWGAMATILISRPSSWQPSELSRAILYHIRNQTFHIPSARGQISPFDDPRWYTLEPAGIASMLPEIARLKRLSNELQIRLPRLIVLVRRVRENGGHRLSSQAIELAVELSHLVDETAESKMLHRIKVAKTTDLASAALLPVSFEYANLGELEAAVVYWKSQLFLAKIKLRLLEMFRDIGFDATEIRKDMARWGVNVMMSHQYAVARQQLAHARGMVAMPTALVALWSLWDTGHDFRGIPIKRWRTWNIERFNEGIQMWQFQATEEDINTTSDLLAGGPLKGRFVAAYSSVPFWATNVPSPLK